MPDTTKRAELIGFVLTHALLRNELPRLSAALAGGPMTPEEEVVVEDQLRVVTDHLLRHHQEEDEFHWPLLVSRAPGAARFLALLEAEHTEMDPLIELVRDRGLSRKERALAMSQLSELVLAHLEVEDRSVVPLLAVHVTADEQRGSMERSRAKIPPADELHVLAMMLAAADEGERVRMLAPLPDFVVTAWSEQAAPALRSVHGVLADVSGRAHGAESCTSAGLGSATGAGMPDITLSGLTKRYAAVTAVDGLTTRASTGRITAFLGANGSGKTTTMRLLLGLSEPDSGSALIGGHRYRDLPHPSRLVGAVLDQGFHPHRSARNHLRIVAAQAGVCQTRAVDDVLAEVGLAEAARRWVGGFSLGMRQRLNLAAAMIGRPENLVLDEPFNGLDPAGIHWMRGFLRSFADNGGSVLLSSHLLSEIAHSADDAIIIDHGRLVSAGPVSSLAAPSPKTRITTPDSVALAAALTRAGAEVRPGGEDSLLVANLSPEEIARVALDARLLVTDMGAENGDLEAVFISLIERTDVTS